MKMLLLAVGNSAMGAPRTFSLQTANTYTLNMRTSLISSYMTPPWHSNYYCWLLTFYDRPPHGASPFLKRIVHFFRIRWRSGNRASPRRWCAGSLNVDFPTYISVRLSWTYRQYAPARNHIPYCWQTPPRMFAFGRWSVCICGKVELSLCLANLAVRHESVLGSGCTDSHFLDLGTIWRWVANFTSPPLYLWETVSVTHSVGPGVRMDAVGKRKILILPGLELRLFCRPARSQPLFRLIYSESYFYITARRPSFFISAGEDLQ
jgi:hypothetical protein